MNKEHTPEPWGYIPQKTGNNQFILVTQSTTGSYRYIGYINDINDAKRIVLCINAMKGIEDPEQWVATAKTHMAASELQANQNQRLKGEVKQLVDALEDSIALINGSNVWVGSSSQHYANENFIKNSKAIIKSITVEDDETEKSTDPTIEDSSLKVCETDNCECPYHACLSDHCQRNNVIENGSDFGPGLCKKNTTGKEAGTK